MAKAKSREPREGGRELLDDIELLNVHRYPDSMPPALVAHVRNSRACQRRLEELLKVLPGRRRDANHWNPLGRPSAGAADDAQPAARSAAAAPAETPAGAGEFRLGDYLRKLFS